jgi:hypothetical protein
VHLSKGNTYENRCLNAIFYENRIAAKELIFSIGVIFQTAATGLPLFVVRRVVTAVGVGIISCIVPMYQSECAPK